MFCKREQGGAYSKELLLLFISLTCICGLYPFYYLELQVLALICLAFNYEKKKSLGVFGLFFCFKRDISSLCCNLCGLVFSREEKCSEVRHQQQFKIQLYEKNSIVSLIRSNVDTMKSA